MQTIQQTQLTPQMRQTKRRQLKVNAIKQLKIQVVMAIQLLS